MKPIILILSVALAFLLFTVVYQNRVLEGQRSVIRLMMQNPCVPLTTQPKSDSGPGSTAKGGSQ
jgi:hypothetical protein